MNIPQAIADTVGFSMVIKPRYASGGRGFEIVKNFAELSEKMRLSWKNNQTLMVQECIPGQASRSINFWLDKKGSVKSGRRNDALAQRPKIRLRISQLKGLETGQES